MRDPERATYGILLVVFVIIGTTVGLYWLLRSYFGLSAAGASILLMPIVFPGLPFFVHSYFVGLRRAGAGEARGMAVSSRSVIRISALSGLMLLPAVLAIHFLVTRDLAMATLFMVISAGVSFWAIHKINQG